MKIVEVFGNLSPMVQKIRDPLMEEGYLVVPENTVSDNYIHRYLELEYDGLAQRPYTWTDKLVSIKSPMKTQQAKILAAHPELNHPPTCTVEPYMELDKDLTLTRALKDVLCERLDTGLAEEYLVIKQNNQARGIGQKKILKQDLYSWLKNPEVSRDEGAKDGTLTHRKISSKGHGGIVVQHGLFLSKEFRVYIAGTPAEVTVIVYERNPGDITKENYLCEGRKENGFYHLYTIPLENEDGIFPELFEIVSLMRQLIIVDQKLPFASIDIGFQDDQPFILEYSIDFEYEYLPSKARYLLNDYMTKGIVELLEDG